MSRKATSIKGEVVDFDLFEVKRQIAKKTQSPESKEREQFVFSKRRRGSRRTVEKMLDDQQKNAASVKESLDAQANAPAPEVEATEAVVEPEPAKVKTKKKTTAKRRIIKKK